MVTEHLADVLHLFPGGAVDDAALPLPGRQKPQQLLILEFRLYDLKVEIRAVKPRHNPEGIFELQNPLHIPPHFFRSGGRKRSHHRAAGQFLQKLDNPKVAGAEILPPLGNAVGLVHCYEGDVQFFRNRSEPGIIQPFRRDIDNLIPTGKQIPVGRLHLCPGQSAVEKGRAHACRLQRHHLIPHQGDQGRYDQGNARHHQCGKLVAHALPTAGWHNTEYVPPGQSRVNQFLLPRAKAGIAEDAL